MADASGLRQHVRARSRQAHVIATADMKTRYRTAAPYKSGDTFRAIDVIAFRSTPNQVAATAIAPTPQAKYTDEGTRPHVIRPRSKKVLRFKVGGRVVFARQVNHPGFKGTGWFSDLGPREWHAALERAVARLS